MTTATWCVRRSARSPGPAPRRRRADRRRQRLGGRHPRGRPRVRAARDACRGRLRTSASPPAPTAARPCSSGELLLFLNPDAVVAPGFRDAIEAPLAAGRGWAAWQGLVTADGGRTINSRGAASCTSPGSPGPAAPASRRRGRCPDLERSRNRRRARPTRVSRDSSRAPAWRSRQGSSMSSAASPRSSSSTTRTSTSRCVLRLAGGRLGLESGARVDHDYEFEKGPGKWRRLERNRWATLIRTYPAGLLGLLLPALLATELALSRSRSRAAGSRRSSPHGSTCSAGCRGCGGSGSAIQATRRITPAEFAQRLTADLDSAYLGAAGRSRVLRALLRAYWSGVRALLPG